MSNFIIYKKNMRSLLHALTVLLVLNTPWDNEWGRERELDVEVT